MTGRRLGAEERALWARVIETVRPLHPRRIETEAPVAAPPASAPPPPSTARAAKPHPPARARPKPGETLDSTWDRRLGRGMVQPDLIVDLHGHNLHAAYTLLDHRLGQAVAVGARVLLLITGKPPTERPALRGRIRDAVGDWLAASRHAGSIAAVRGAHPRHGGAGALYIVLRRRRGDLSR